MLINKFIKKTTTMPQLTPKPYSYRWAGAVRFHSFGPVMVITHAFFHTLARGGVTWLIVGQRPSAWLKQRSRPHQGVKYQVRQNFFTNYRSPGDFFSSSQDYHIHDWEPTQSHNHLKTIWSVSKLIHKWKTYNSSQSS